MTDETTQVAEYGCARCKRSERGDRFAMQPIVPGLSFGSLSLCCKCWNSVMAFCLPNNWIGGDNDDSHRRLLPDEIEKLTQEERADNAS